MYAQKEEEEEEEEEVEEGALVRGGVRGLCSVNFRLVVFVEVL